MVKAYKRYEHAGCFGVITSGAKPCYDAAGKHLITSALETITIWNVKQGSLVRHWLPSMQAGGQFIMTVQYVCCPPFEAPLLLNIVPGWLTRAKPECQWGRFLKQYGTGCPRGHVHGAGTWQK